MKDDLIHGTTEIINENFGHKNLQSNKCTILAGSSDGILKFTCEKDLLQLQGKWSVITSYFQ